MRALIVLSLLVLAGCAADRTPLYRDSSGAHRQDAALKVDEAQCHYEVGMAAASSQGRPVPIVRAGEFSAAAYNLGLMAQAFPVDGLYAACIKARGWQLVGYE